MSGIQQGLLASMGGAPQLSAYLAAALEGSPYIAAWPWSDSTGFGTIYSNPSVIPGSGANFIDISSDGLAVACALVSSPYVAAYKFSGSGFGTKYSDPATTIAGYAVGIKFLSNNTAIAIAHDNSPYVTVYAWSNSTGFGSKFSDPATLPAGFAIDVDFSPNNTAIAVAHNNTPYVTAYPWSGSGFGTKFSNPASLPTENGRSVAFSNASNVLAVGVAGQGDGTVSLYAYAWSGSGFGTKFSNPSPTKPERTVASISFTPNDDAIAVNLTAIQDAAFVYSWSNSTGFGTRYSNPVSPEITMRNACSFNQTGTALSYCGADSGANGFVQTFAWSSITGFGSNYARPQGTFVNCSDIAWWSP